MANTSYELGWKTFLKCKGCWEFKELNTENWYTHKEGYLWVLWRCKKCILAWRKTEHERKMARERDKDRYYNNPKRREYVYQSSKERTERHEKEGGWWNKYHLRTNRIIKKLWIRPKECPICWYKWRIVAHHPDYKEWNKIVFCCQPCHDKIHKKKLDKYTVIDLLN